MNKNFFSALFLAGALVYACSLHAIDAFVEAKAAYYYPTDHRFRRIYSGGGIYGVEATCQTWKDLYAWASADCFYQTGSSIGGHNSTRITFIPLGLGLKYLFPVSFVDLYVGAGILGTWLHIKDNSRFVIHSSSKWGVGGIAKVGAIFNVNRHFFIDVFTNYSYTKIDFHKTNHGKVVRTDADISGFSFGGALGYRFGSGRPKKKPTTSVENKKVSFEKIEPIKEIGMLEKDSVAEPTEQSLLPEVGN